MAAQAAAVTACVLEAAAADAASALDDIALFLFRPRFFGFGHRDLRSKSACDISSTFSFHLFLPPFPPTLSSLLITVMVPPVLAVTWLLYLRDGRLRDRASVGRAEGCEVVRRQGREPLGWDSRGWQALTICGHTGRRPCRPC